MTRSTGELRSLWGPPCPVRQLAKVTLYGGAVVSVRASTVDAWLALSAVLERWSYPATPPDCGAFNCRAITGGTGYSLHAYGIAVDINWTVNPYGSHLHTDMPRGMVNDILAIRTNSGAQVFRWGGDYTGNKDAMHYEIICTPADIATGIRVETQPQPPGGGTPPPDEEDEVTVIVVKPDGTRWHVDGCWRKEIDQQTRDTMVFLGAREVVASETFWHSVENSTVDAWLLSIDVIYSKAAAEQTKPPGG